jgi:TonB family protein
VIADVAVRTSVVLLAGLALRAVLGPQSAALRHNVVAVTLLCAALVVPASFVLPSWTVAVEAALPVASELPHKETNATASSGASAAEPATPAPGHPMVLVWWAAGFLAMIGTLVTGILRLRHIASRGTRLDASRWIDATRAVAASYGLRRDVVLIEGASPFMIATWGWRPARVLLPPGASSWSDARVRVVLSHELAHVVRADWAVQVASQVVLATLWFNPLTWLVCRELRRESELACDDAVLRQGVGAPDYASHLVALARLCRRPSWSAWMPALPMARPSGFERRIAAMLNPRLDRRPLSLGIATAMGAALVALTSAVAAAHTGQALPAELSGTVYDPSGGVIPGVTLTLSTSGQRSVSTTGGALTVTEPQQSATQATTDSSGRFSFPGIAPGRYVLSASLPGFRQLREEFDLKAIVDWNRAVTLQVGTLRETISVSATRTFATPAASGPSPIRVGGNIRVPLKVRDVKPVYPESMRAEGREADVQLEATIGRDGSVSTVRVLSAQIHPDFAIAAVDAVRQWRFTPTLLNGQPIEVVMTVAVRFSLAD